MRCPVCDNENNELFYSDVKGYAIQQSFNLLKCPNCGLVFTESLMSEKELQKYYNNQEIAFNGIGGNSFIDQYLLNKEKVWDGLGYADRYNEILRFHPGVKSVLDVGCGTGLFIDYLKCRGLTVYGIELSQWGYEVATQRLHLQVFNSDLGKMGTGEDLPKVDVVTMYDVLEHSMNPRLMINTARKILSQNGILIINLPNIESYISRLTGKYWNKLIPPNHLTHFSPNSLKYLLEKEGFRIQSLNTNNGDPKELVSEIMISPFRILGKYSPRILDAYANRDESLVTFHSWEVKMIKVIRRVGKNFGFLAELINPTLSSRQTGEGLHVIAE